MQRYRHFRGPYGQADVKNGQEKNNDNGRSENENFPKNKITII
jgi:hypothetical protein